MLSSDQYAKWRRDFIEHHFSQPRSFSENTHNSWTTWYIFMQLCINLQEVTSLLITHPFRHTLIKLRSVDYITSCHLQVCFEISFQTNDHTVPCQRSCDIFSTGMSGSNSKKIVKRYIRVWYNLDIMRQSACLVLNPITIYSYGFLFNCTMVGHASDLMTALTSGFNRWVGAWCLSVAGPTVAQLEVFFSSDYLWVMSPFLCFIIVC